MTDALYIALSAIVGLMIGSFLNVVIYRVPLGMNIAFPASHCPVCGNKLKWYHNIPVLSWLFLGGKCAFCKVHISVRYMIVEMLNAVLWVFCFLVFGESVFTVLAMLFVSVCIAIIYIDFDHMIIPDSLSVAIAILGVLACIFGDDALSSQWWERLIGGFGMLGVMVGIYYLSSYIMKREALGGGDIKFLAVCGLFLGWKMVLLGLFFGALFGCIIVVSLILAKKHDREKPFPFGPFLSLGMITALLIGSGIINVYLELY